MANGWKIAAIIFLIIAIVELALIGWFYQIGTEAIDNEYECSVNICAEYDAFYYDGYQKICFCYLNHEIAYYEYMSK